MIGVETSLTSANPLQRLVFLPRLKIPATDIIKTPEDRVALVKAILEGSGKFFFGELNLQVPLRPCSYTMRRKRFCASPPRV